MSTATTLAGTRAARRASRRPQLQYLLTADENSLTELEVVLSTLPLCAVGRVFIEVPGPDDISVVTAPPRMTVTWLPRSRRAGAIGSGRRCASGEALTRAAVAWADEMLCDESASPLRTEITLLGDFLSTADIVEHLTDRHGIDAGAIHAPERYGLSVR